MVDCSVPVTDVFVPVVFACFVHMNFQFLFILFPYISEHLPLFSMLIGQTRFHSVHIYVRMCVPCIETDRERERASIDVRMCVLNGVLLLFIVSPSL